MTYDCQPSSPGPSCSDSEAGSSSKGRMSTEGSEEFCWVCMDEGSGERPLMKQCNCPNRSAHAECDARWRLQQAGKMEETKCRFCAAPTPGWKQVLQTIKQASAARNPPLASPALPLAALPSGSRNEILVKINSRDMTDLSEKEPKEEVPAGAHSAAIIPAKGPAANEPSRAYMRISWGGKTHHIQVGDGPDGRKKFVEDCRQLLEIPSSVNFDIVYHCKEPFAGGDLTLRGLEAYDAAFFCAAASAPAPASVSGRKSRKTGSMQSAHAPSESESASGLSHNSSAWQSIRARREGSCFTGRVMRAVQHALCLKQ